MLACRSVLVVWFLLEIGVQWCVVAVEIGVWVSVFGVWWVSAIEIEDFWWVLGMWVTGFQGLVAVDGGGGGGGGGSFC